jgi:hypothetical protein
MSSLKLEIDTRHGGIDSIGLSAVWEVTQREEELDPERLRKGLLYVGLDLGSCDPCSFQGRKARDYCMNLLPCGSATGGARAEGSIRKASSRAIPQN